jgi:two-component system LytT family response regulator
MKIFDDEHLQAVINNYKYNDNRVMFTAQNSHNIVDIDDMIRCETHKDFTIITFKDGSDLKVFRSLNKIQKMLEHTDIFIRVSMSDLININYVDKVVKLAKGKIKMINGDEVSITQRRKSEVIEQLKSKIKNI